MRRQRVFQAFSIPGPGAEQTAEVVVRWALGLDVQYKLIEIERQPLT